MLFTIDGNGGLRQVTRIPHAVDYRNWKRRLTDQAFQAIRDTLDARIDSGEIHTAGWIPGADWSGTVFWPIYQNACNGDRSAAAKFFGLIVWKMFMDHPEHWSCGRYVKDSIPIESMTYFRIT